MKNHIACAVLLLALFMLSGCAGMNQIVAAKESSGKVAVQTANDNIATGLEDALCDLPYGTVVRTQKIQPAVVSVCGAVTVQFPMQVPVAAQ